MHGTGMHYADLDLGYGSFKARRYATKVRIRLEHVNDPGSNTVVGEPTGRPLQIKVIDGKSRKPLADVMIVGQVHYSDRELHSEVLLYATDADGVCRIAGLRPGSISLTIQKNGYGAVECGRPIPPSVQAGPDSQVIEMRPAQPIGGVIQDQDGKPIADVEVQITVNSREVGGMGYLDRVVQTNKDGCWRVDGVQSEPDTVTLGLKHLQYVSNYAWDTTHILPDQLPAAQAFQHIERLSKGVSIQGRVLDANGQPLPRAAVTLAPPRRNGFQYGYACVLTDTSGRFQFGCAKDMRGDTRPGGGPTAVYVEAPGYAPMMKKLFIEPNVPPLEFRLSPGRTLAARIVNSDGQTIPGATVQLNPLSEDPGNSLSLNVSTDDQGRFQVTNVPDADVRATISKKGYLTIKDHVLSASAGECVLTMASGARVQGTVRDAETGQPIPHFKAILSEATKLDIVQFHDSGEFSDGTYEFCPDKKVPVDLWLQVAAPGYKWARSEAFRLEEGTRQVDLKLEKEPSSGKVASPRPASARVVHGIVQDPNGRPASKASVSTAPLLGVHVTTEPEGKFKVVVTPSMMAPPGAREGPVYLIARDPEHDLAAAVRLDSAITGDIVVRLIPGIVVAGRVVDPERKGVAGVVLSPMFHSGPGGAQVLPGIAKSDPNGNFEVRALPGGYRYTIQATADAYGDGYAEVDTRKAVGNRLRLKPLVLLSANLRVSGVVVTSEGTPVLGITVCGSADGQPTRETRTDAQGRFTLEKVCAGPIRIVADRRSGGTAILHGSASKRRRYRCASRRDGQRPAKQPKK